MILFLFYYKLQPKSLMEVMIWVIISYDQTIPGQNVPGGLFLHYESHPVTHHLDHRADRLGIHGHSDAPDAVTDY